MIEIQKNCGGTSGGKKTLGEKFQKFGFTGKNLILQQYIAK